MERGNALLLLHVQYKAKRFLEYDNAGNSSISSRSTKPTNHQTRPRLSNQKIFLNSIPNDPACHPGHSLSAVIPDPDPGSMYGDTIVLNYVLYTWIPASAGMTSVFCCHPGLDPGSHEMSKCSQYGRLCSTTS